MSIKDILITLITLIPLTIAGITDYKRRIIPNYCCALIGLIGLVGAAILSPADMLFFPLSHRIAGFLLPAIFMVLYAMKNEGATGGGDVKLIAVIGLTFGIVGLVYILTLTIFTGLLWAKIHSIKSIPLATFIMISVWSLAIYFFLGR